jgi:hypothetical protein
MEVEWFKGSREAAKVSLGFQSGQRLLMNSA